MFIAIDVGNTNVSVGILKDLEVIYSFKIETGIFENQKKSKAFILEKLSGILPSSQKICGVYICSVVPALNKNIKTIFKAVFKMEVVVIGEDVIVPVLNRYRLPKQVGQDRLVNAYAGLKLYGNGFIIVDFGTAVTFDIVSKSGEYLGGLIAPGLKLMQESLNKRTALLPYVELARPIEIIGRDTVSSIRAGIVYGVAGMCDGIISKLLAKECRGYKVIATGGDAALIQPYCKYLSVFEEGFIFKGLALIHKSQQTLPAGRQAAERSNK